MHSDNRDGIRSKRWLSKCSVNRGFLPRKVGKGVDGLGITAHNKPKGRTYGELTTAHPTFGVVDVNMEMRMEKTLLNALADLVVPKDSLIVSIMVPKWTIDKLGAPYLRDPRIRE